MTIRQLHHVQLAVPAGGEERARQFYGNVLGFREVAKPAQLAARGGCWFVCGESALHLGVESDFTPARKAHPAFLVSGLSALAARLASLGYPVTEDLPLEGYRRFYTADPFGNRIEFLEEL